MWEKLNDSQTTPKTYWKIINCFLSSKKIHAIPSSLVNGEIISNLSQRTFFFNNFFSSQCTPLQNSSSLPTFYLRTDETLSLLNISDDDILLLLKAKILINPMDGITYRLM